MLGKLILCRTRLEEAESQLRDLAMSEGEDSDLRQRLVVALTYVEKALAALRADTSRAASES